MTNFEWLVKTNQYDKFVNDFIYMGSQNFRERYDIHERTGFSISMDVLMWLNQEHKEQEKQERYVRLEDVLEILRGGKEKFIPTWTKSGKCKFEVPTIDFALWYEDKMNKIKHLEHKTEGEI